MATGVPCVATGVPCVATWFSGYKKLLGRNIVVSCFDSALFLYCDDVATEVSMLQPTRPRQEVRCCTLHVAIGLALARVSLSR